MNNIFVVANSYDQTTSNTSNGTGLVVTVGLVNVVSPIGCGLAGYKYDDIAPMFRNSPKNVILPEEFKKVLNG